MNTAAVSDVSRSPTHQSVPYTQKESNWQGRSLLPIDQSNSLSMALQEIFNAIGQQNLPLEQKLEQIRKFKQLNGQLTDELVYAALMKRDYAFLKLLIDEGATASCKMNRENYSALTPIQALLWNLTFTSTDIVLIALKWLVEKGRVKVCEDDLVFGPRLAPKAIIKYLLEHYQGSLSVNLLKKVGSLPYEPNVDTASLFFKRLEPELTPTNTSPLQLPIRNGYDKLVQCYIDYNVPVEPWDELLQDAKLVGNLSTIRNLFNTVHKGITPEDFINKFIGQELRHEGFIELELKIFHYLLHSSLEEGKKFIHDMQLFLQQVDLPPQRADQLNRWLESIVNTFRHCGGLVARHTSLNCRWEMNKTYATGTAQEYIEHQLRFAKSFDSVIKKTLQLPDVASRSLVSLIQEWGKERAAFAQKSSHVRDPKTYETIRTGGLQTGFALRYGFAIDFVKKIMQANNFDFYYLLYNGVLLTKVYLNEKEIFAWDHTHPDTMKQLLPEIEKLHLEVMNNPLNRENAESLKAFYELVATTFWLGTNLVITNFGNSHYFLVWLSFVMQHHKFCPLIPKLQYPHPDCIALSVPLETFISNFLSYFEPQ